MQPLSVDSTLKYSAKAHSFQVSENEKNNKNETEHRTMVARIDDVSHSIFTNKFYHFSVSAYFKRLQMLVVIDYDSTPGRTMKPA